MTGFNFICETVQQMKKKYDESDPFQVCKEMEIPVLYASMGTGDACCKGFFFPHSRIRTITINSDLSRDIQRIICSHELGHAVLHRKCTGVKAFHDFALFDTASKYEYEANIFAAEFLLPDSNVLEVLNGDLSFFQAAAALYVPAEILDFKFRIMKQKGYALVDPPIITNGNFLKNIDIPIN